MVTNTRRKNTCVLHGEITKCYVDLFTRFFTRFFPSVVGVFSDGVFGVGRNHFGRCIWRLHGIVGGAGTKEGVVGGAGGWEGEGGWRGRG